MDPTVSGVGAKSLIESSLIERLSDQVAQTPASETRQLVAFAAEMRGVASPALPLSSASLVNPGTLAGELLKRLDPFLEKAHAYGRIAMPDDLARSMPNPLARAGVAVAALDPPGVHPGPARKSFALPVPKIDGGIESRFPDRAFDGTIGSTYDTIIADLFGSDEHFQQWTNDMIGDLFKARIFNTQLALVARGLRGATEAVSALTTRQS
jgi:hypothetical protein